MKTVIKSFILLVILFLVVFYKNDITDYVVKNYFDKKSIEVPDSNSYKRDYDFMFVQNTDNFYPNNKQELYNVFYTILNNGYHKFSFYCGDEYKDCSKDIAELTEPTNEILGALNNYVHPFNSYKSIHISMNHFGKITVDVKKIYSNEDITKINNQIDVLYKSLIKPGMTNEMKIKTIHNYIINNTKYDTKYNNNPLDKNTKSNTAYGPLFNKVSLCGGYTDLMELFLEKMNIKSYKISSEKHIWNYAYVNNSWKHLDLTWDDPVTNTGKNLLEYNYFLINTQKIKALNDKQHIYDKSLYLEAK